MTEMPPASRICNDCAHLHVVLLEGGTFVWSCRTVPIDSEPLYVHEGESTDFMPLYIERPHWCGKQLLVNQ